jgi:2-polyprenyl-3-methyl-5-hydroxy-6-metoxy-1,4-benzoquinol methylase
VSGEADAVFGTRMTRAYGGPVKGGMPLYKFAGNKILTYFENRALGLRLTEFHSGYRAYSLAALRKIDFVDMTDVFHFDTQIIIKLHHQGYVIKEVPIPTYYGDEICYVDGLKYAKDVMFAVMRYRRTTASLARYPEYKEYFVQYPIKRSRYSSHYYFAQWVGAGNRVLDIGCGEGFFADMLAKAGNDVVGIDILPGPRQRDSMKQYVQADLDQGLHAALPALAEQRFDRVLLQDILEHVRSPEKVLADCHRLLDARGLVLISVPNVANITVRLALLFGRFEYTERGILDRTHVRFFTRRTAREMIERAGYDIVAEKVTVMPLELVLGARPDGLPMRVIGRILAAFTRALPRLLGYQLLYLARSRTTQPSAAQQEKVLTEAAA